MRPSAEGKEKSETVILKLQRGSTCSEVIGGAFCSFIRLFELFTQRLLGAGHSSRCGMQP